jgi:hypothetical protein
MEDNKCDLQPTPFPQPTAQADEVGANMDLRVRIASQILSSSPALAEIVKACMVGDADTLSKLVGPLPHARALQAGKIAAVYALEAASHLLGLGETLGLVSPPSPFTGTLSEAEMGRARRLGATMVEQQVGHNIYANNMAQKGELPAVLVAKPAGGGTIHLGGRRGDGGM